MKSKIILLKRVKKENYLVKGLANIASFDYFDKSLLVLSATSAIISIALLEH